MGAGNLEVSARETNRRDEIANLAVDVNDMIRGLKERDLIRDTFGRMAGNTYTRTTNRFDLERPVLPGQTSIKR